MNIRRDLTKDIKSLIRLKEDQIIKLNIKSRNYNYFYVYGEPKPKECLYKDRMQKKILNQINALHKEVKSLKELRKG